jgi:hypothetical protein
MLVEQQPRRPKTATERGFDCDGCNTLGHLS